MEERSPRRPRRIEENNIRMDLKEIGWKAVDWIHLAQDKEKKGGGGRAHLKTVTNLWFL
jgi:hypothetical protein